MRPTRSPLRQPAFQKLLAVFVLNGTASAIPATLVLFFVQDRLQASPSVEPAFLATYFLCAALSIPLWVKLVARIGLDTDLPGKHWTYRVAFRRWVDAALVNATVAGLTSAQSTVLLWNVTHGVCPPSVDQVVRAQAPPLPLRAGSCGRRL